MICWLIDKFVRFGHFKDWLVDWFKNEWLVYIYRLIDWMVPRWFGILVFRIIYKLNSSLNYWVGLLVGWLDGWLIDVLVYWFDGLIDWLINLVIDWLVDWWFLVGLILIYETNTSKYKTKTNKKIFSNYIF